MYFCNLQTHTCARADTHGETFLYFFLVISGPAVLIFYIFLIPSVPYNVTYIIFFTSTLAMYFILGSVMGWIIGKIKSPVK